MTHRDTPRLFVYGSLRHGEVNPYAADLHAHAGLLGRARLRGRLYAISWFSGVVLSGDPSDVVHGEVFALHAGSAAEVLARMDEYEGPQFERRRVEVEMETGETVECWVYFYRGDVEGRERVASGEWPRDRRG